MSEQNPSDAQPPFGSPQQSFGSAPPPPQQQFGQAPGYGAAPPPVPPPVEPPAKKRSAAPRIIIALVVVAVLAGVGWWLNRDAATNAKVGDCFDSSAFTDQLTDASGTKTVDCNSAQAKYKVVGIVDNKQSSELETNLDATCGPFAGAEAGIWIGEQGKAGKIYCVDDISNN